MPTLIRIPAGTVSSNEVAEIWNSLTLSGHNAPQGTVATLPAVDFAVGGAGDQYYIRQTHTNTANHTVTWPELDGGVCLTTGCGASSDNFNRVNGSLGSNWTTQPTTNAPTVVSNAVTASAIATAAYNTLWTANTFLANQFSQVQVTNTGSASGTGIGLTCRGNAIAASETNYIFQFTAGNFQLVLRNSGTSTQIGTNIAGTLNTNDILRFECNGSSLKGYQNGTLVISGTDTTLASGALGIRLSYNTPATTAPVVDNWSGGNLAAIAQINVAQAWAASQSFNSGLIASTISTSSNCSVNGASPAACGSAASGAVVVPTTTATYTVNTTAVTANSRIMVEPVTDATGLSGSPTCTAPASPFTAYVSGRVAGTSFSVTLPNTTGTTCWYYWIVN